MEFVKLVGSGNDFVVLDNLNGKIRDGGRLAKLMCHRKFGVGADGLLLLERSNKADFRMRIFNPDGSEAEMCGNGLRCLTRFISLKHFSSKRRLTVETRAGIHETFILGASIRTSMRIVGKPNLNQKITVDGHQLTVHFINTGVPHAVILVDEIVAVQVSRQGPQVRFHPFFQPAGTNVDWIEITGKNTLKIRTYERGVEAETLSCGTGTVAAAIVAYLLNQVNPPVSVLAASGEKLNVDFSPDLEKIFLEGRTSFPFSGTWLLGKKK
ncbi:MAG: diaminopimelate epimerase [Candidatus Omnitrophica bacterium]|nr:diaminopimelate epimerase [Candidatus Omnitrophota bacterium]